MTSRIGDLRAVYDVDDDNPDEFAPAPDVHGGGAAKDGGRKSRTRSNRKKKRSGPDAPPPNLAHENREERMHVRFDIPFHLLIDGQVLEGRDISFGGLSTKKSPRGAKAGDTEKAEIAIRFSGFRVQIPAGMKLISIEDGGSARYEFTHIAETEHSILKKILTSYLSGHHLTLEQLTHDEDPQTVRDRVKRDRQKLPKPAPNFVRFGIAVTALAVLLLGLGIALYDELFIIEPSFAAVTAPKIDIRAPNDGKLAAHNLNAGAVVKRDQELVRVIDHDIKAQLDLTKATLEYNERLVANLNKSLEKGGKEFSIVTSTDDQTQAPVIKDLSKLEAQARVEEFKSTLQFTRAKIDALETKLAGGAIFSPCDCLVTWIRSEDGGYFVQKGEPLAELVVRGSDDVNVEALVHLDQIDQIEPNQRVQVILPTTREAVPARVEAIQLESERMQRAGFPKWARQDLSHGSVVLSVDEKLTAEMVGVPVDVRFIDADTDAVRAIADLLDWASDKTSDLFAAVWSSSVVQADTTKAE